MFPARKKSKQFFERLCVDYYEKILRYLYGALGNEAAAKDCVQDVFLIACQKSEVLMSHPNPGGFLFQTAKNLACKARREGFQRMLRELPAEDGANALTDPLAGIERALDNDIDETAYIEAVLSRLTAEKRKLYSLYYLNNNSMAEVAVLLGIGEAAARMRYVRLRREICEIVSEIARSHFSFCF